MDKFKNERPRGYYTAMVAVVAVLSLVVFFALGKLLPFQPFEFGKYDVKPVDVCPGEPVEVTYTANIKSGLYTIDSMSGSAYWVYPDNGKPYDSSDIMVEDLDATNGFEEFDSAIQRIAPLTPERWPVGATMHVHGRMFGLVSRTQTVKVQSAETTVIKGYQDTSCFNRGSNM